MEPAEYLLPPLVRERLQTLSIKGGGPEPGEDVDRMLVRSPNWLGDAVMSLPVLAGLRSFFPQAEITVLAVPRVAPLFASQPGVAETLPYPPGRERWSLLRSLRGRFQLALALPNSLESALGLWLSGAPHRVGYRSDGRSLLLTRALGGRRRLAGLHQVYYYLGLLRAFGEVDRCPPPTLHPEAEEITAAQGFLWAMTPEASGPWVGMSPGAAYGPAKRWPPERFAALADRLHREVDARLVLLGGPEDRETAERLRACLRAPVLDLVGRTSLRQALAVLTQMAVLITNDSGLMHAAAALNVPVVAIFGSTDPEATGPFSAKATVLRHFLTCSPCFRRDCKLDYPCLTAIEVDEVVAAVRPWLAEGG